ncbi:MAG: hypothetical protein AAB436_02300 [Patescibacteria group bacterium]
MTSSEQTEPPNFVIDSHEYELTVAAAKDLGLRSTAEYLIRNPESVESAIISPIKNYLGKIAGRDKPQPELTIHLPFTETYTINDLVGHFNRRQRYNTVVDEELWKGYHKGSYNGRLIRPVLGIVINETKDPAGNYNDMVNGYEEIGLTGMGKTPDLQRNLASNHDRVKIDLISVSQYILLQAKRRIAGLPPLDEFTETCFPQLMGYRGQDAFAPTIGWKYDRLELRSIEAKYAGADVGVRKVIDTGKQILVPNSRLKAWN